MCRVGDDFDCLRAIFPDIEFLQSLFGCVDDGGRGVELEVGGWRRWLSFLSKVEIAGRRVGGGGVGIFQATQTSLLSILVDELLIVTLDANGGKN